MEKRKSREMNLIMDKLPIPSDQTPTPTRFIRNCEEVGLFQDLQNVNPFDETFRKAVELKSNDSAHLEKPANTLLDDTLHTPNVFPHIIDQPQLQLLHVEKSKTEEALEKLRKSDKRSCNRNRESNMQQNNTALAEQCYVLMDRNVTFKIPLPRLPPAIKVFSPKHFSVFSKNLTRKPARNEPNNESKFPSKVEKRRREDLKESNRNEPNNESKFPSKVEKRRREDLKEGNRLAAIRTREKKRHYLFYLEELNKKLTEQTKEMENIIVSLTQENTALKRELMLSKETTTLNNDMHTDQQVLHNCKAKQTNLSLGIPQTMNNPSSVIACETRDITLPQQSECFYSTIETNKSEPLGPNESDFRRKPIKKRRFPPKLIINCSIPTDLKNTNNKGLTL